MAASGGVAPTPTRESDGAQLAPSVSTTYRGTRRRTATAATPLVRQRGRGHARRTVGSPGPSSFTSRSGERRDGDGTSGSSSGSRARRRARGRSRLTARGQTVATPTTPRTAVSRGSRRGRQTATTLTASVRDASNKHRGSSITVSPERIIALRRASRRRRPADHQRHRRVDDGLGRQRALHLHAHDRRHAGCLERVEHVLVEHDDVRRRQPRRLTGVTARAPSPAQRTVTVQTARCSARRSTSPAAGATVGGAVDGDDGRERRHRYTTLTIDGTQVPPARRRLTHGARRPTATPAHLGLTVRMRPAPPPPRAARSRANGGGTLTVAITTPSRRAGERHGVGHHRVDGPRAGTRTYTMTVGGARSGTRATAIARRRCRGSPPRDEREDPRSSPCATARARRDGQRAVRWRIREGPRRPGAGRRRLAFVPPAARRALRAVLRSIRVARELMEAAAWRRSICGGDRVPGGRPARRALACAVDAPRTAGQSARAGVIVLYGDGPAERVLGAYHLIRSRRAASYVPRAASRPGAARYRLER